MLCMHTRKVRKSTNENRSLFLAGLIPMQSILLRHMHDNQPPPIVPEAVEFMQLESSILAGYGYSPEPGN